MKTILILRHAKSSWKHPGLEDHERPLKKRGLRDAPRMGRLLVDLELAPERIVSSTAERARSTAKLAADACGYEHDIGLSESMYLSGADAYIDELRVLPDSVRRAMVVGHNPDVEELVFLLTGRNEVMPTAALAHVRVPAESWNDLRTGLKGELLGLWRPKELGEGPE